MREDVRRLLGAHGFSRDLLFCHGADAWNIFRAVFIGNDIGAAA